MCRIIKPIIVLFLGLLASDALAQGYETELVVAKDGSGDYSSIQAAIDDAKSFPYERITILIKNGVYKEKVKVHSWNTKLSLIGENKDSTVITWDDYFDKIDRGRNSTFHTYTLLVEANDFYAENITIENSAGDVGQAVALHIDADRVSIQKCRILGNQDTVYLAGEGKRQYFNNCYIEGTTDFIFGGATGLFEDCQIHSKKDSYITAASTPQGQQYGFVFKNSTLTADESVNEVYLGRPWRNYAKTVFMKTELGGHIMTEGWHNWNKPDAESTVYYAEYENSGLGFKPSERVEWSYQLKAEEAEKYAKEKILKGWNPADENR
ncbi:pectinesterase family protein [Gracilimonas sp.]|uniref:pectinesterase family protein n=1 Tax=Gracilimonas sp. TaxID=1974203 RepID=UPI0032EB5D64